MRNIVAALSLLVLVGCQVGPGPSIKGMNTQRMMIRDAADASTTISFDFVTDASIVQVQKDTKNYAIAVLAFLETGNVGDLTIPVLVEALKKIVPADYQFLVELLVAQISIIHVDVDKIGVDNVKRMKALCTGVIFASDQYKIDERPVQTKALNAPASPAEIQSFGARLRGEMSKRR